MDEMLAGWQWLYLDTLNALQDGVESGTLTYRDRQSAAITLGISTEKTLLLAGMPTAIVSNISDVRHELGPLMARLIAASNRVAATPLVVDAVPITDGVDLSVRKD